jgi:ketosteroid isomerase-like protein
MTTKEIADKLVSICRKGDFKKAISELYADDAVSVEPNATPAFEKETKGLKAILAKGDKWNAMVTEVHKVAMSDPIVASNSFACTLNMEVTIKERGHMDIAEICLYQVKDGKIISEHFYM